MTQSGWPEPSFLQTLSMQLEQLDPHQRREALMEVIRLLATAPTEMRPGPGMLDSARGNKAVVLCDWAADGGRAAEEQLLRIDMRPGATQIANTHEATGRPLITNGFLGADLIHVPAGEGFAPHIHPGDHLLFVVGGRGTITAAGEIVETAPGLVYMVDGAQTHAVGAITDHVLLSVGVVHQPLDSGSRQELRPFDELMTDGHLTCRICDCRARSADELRAAGCSHSPATFSVFTR